MAKKKKKKKKKKRKKMKKKAKGEPSTWGAAALPFTPSKIVPSHLRASAGGDLSLSLPLSLFVRCVPRFRRTVGEHLLAEILCISSASSPAGIPRCK
jgi:hypothetical protein